MRLLGCRPLFQGPVGDYRRWPMLEWIKKDDTHSEHPMRDVASASALLANLRGSGPVAALVDLTGWAESLKSAVGFDPHVESEVLAMIQETGAPHVSGLIKQYLADTEAKLVLREAKWKSLFDYASALMEALYRSADRLLRSTRRQKRPALA